MNSVQIKKTDLLEILHKNRAEHVEEYQEAVADYKLALKKHHTDLYQEMLSHDAMDTLLVWNTKLQAPYVPQNHEHDYIDAIDILNYEVRDIIELDRSQYKTLVKNNWSWKTSFSQTMAFNKSYISS